MRLLHIAIEGQLENTLNHCSIGSAQTITFGTTILKSVAGIWGDFWQNGQKMNDGGVILFIL